MGEGIKAAKAMGSGPHAEVMENFKEQLLIVFLKRLGGKIDIPVSEVDDTAQDILSFCIRDKVFYFELSKKE